MIRWVVPILAVVLILIGFLGAGYAGPLVITCGSHCGGGGQSGSVTASFSYMTNGTTVTVDDTSTVQGSVHIEKQTVTWGDGTNGPISWHGSAQHVYAATGKYGVTETVAYQAEVCTGNLPYPLDCSVQDYASSVTHYVVVSNGTSPPPGTLPPSIFVQFNATVSNLTVTVVDETIYTYSRATSIVWYWGDGSPNSTGTTATHTYQNASTYTITEVVTAVGVIQGYTDTYVNGSAAITLKAGVNMTFVASGSSGTAKSVGFLPLPDAGGLMLAGLALLVTGVFPYTSMRPEWLLGSAFGGFIIGFIVWSMR